MRLRLVDVPRLSLQRGRQPGVQGCFLRRFGVFFDKDGRLIDVGAANAAKDYEGGYFFGGLRAILG